MCFLSDLNLVLVKAIGYKLEPAKYQWFHSLEI